MSAVDPNGAAVPPAGAPAGTGSGRPSQVATVVAVALVACYLALLGILVALRGDQHWDHLVYLLSGFEALVFAGGGALFGSTVQRVTVEAARTEAANARAAAQTERSRATAAEAEATAGRLLSTAVQTEERLGAEALELGGSATPPPQLTRLAELARSLFPQHPTHRPDGQAETP